jgi:hypothetical protein
MVASMKGAREISLLPSAYLGGIKNQAVCRQYMPPSCEIDAHGQIYIEFIFLEYQHSVHHSKTSP